MNKSNSSIHGSPGPARTKKIFVGGLASSVTESDFKKYFDQFGVITDVVVMYDHNTQRPRGFGFITYDSEEVVERVLQKTFHELNGKMVEVKRAVPKELSPGSSRNQLGGYNHGLSRISSFLNGYTQGYNPSSVGGYGVRMDGRYSPVTVGRGGFSPFGAGYGNGLNFEQNFNPNYGGSANSVSNLSYGRGMSPSYGGNSNRYGSPAGYGGSTGGNNSILSSTGRNLWGGGGLNYVSNSSNSSAFMNAGNGSSGMGSLGSIEALWGSSPSSGQAGATGFTYGSGKLNYSGEDLSVGSAVGYGRNGASAVAPASSHAMSNGNFDGSFSDSYENNSFYGDSTWRSPSDLEGSRSFGLGIGNGTSDVMVKSSAAYLGGYGVANRQTNRG